MYVKKYANFGYKVWECSTGYRVKITSRIVGDFSERIIHVPYDNYTIRPKANLLENYLGDELGAMIYRIADMGLRDSIVIHRGPVVESIKEYA
tara:strand:- start:2064 stop:2342 length:279 start_codon:yes stop_codon:yes gene_type:complete